MAREVVKKHIFKCLSVLLVFLLVSIFFAGSLVLIACFIMVYAMSVPRVNTVR